MSIAKFLWHDYRYFPYEKDLAARELRRLTGHEPSFDEDGLSVELPDDLKTAALRATYFSRVVDGDGTVMIPLQAHLEQSNGLLDAEIGRRPARRQSTRYSSHGLHEYKGKFNPQVVRAIGNLLGAKPGDWVLDPFCGSGTTLVESAHNGWNAVGIDMNPLAVEIANAKIACMQVPVERIECETQRIIDALVSAMQGVSYQRELTDREVARLVGRAWSTELPHYEYLSNWFSESALVQLALIKREVEARASGDLRPVYNIVVSDILRDVSLQDPYDLRIRRRKDVVPNPPVVALFVDQLNKKMRTVIKARCVLGQSCTQQRGVVGDSKRASNSIASSDIVPLGGQFDLAITSPPYATALPYIDTQRLSLVWLGLIPPSEILPLDAALVGSREVRGQSKSILRDYLLANHAGLPAKQFDYCRTLEEALTDDDGFRRRAVPLLLYRYFADMADVFRSVRDCLRYDGRFALVVGGNHTILGGTRFDIDTPRHLTDIAKERGWEHVETIPLQTYQRYGYHMNNAVSTESLIVLRAT